MCKDRDRHRDTYCARRLEREADAEPIEKTVERERRGTIGAATLSLHSFLDGLGIGLAFQASSAVGIAVAIAVLAHDFSDGINTVHMVLKHSGERARALRWLLWDAIAPALGVIATM